MKEKFYLKNTLLAVEMGIVCLAVILGRTFIPGFVLPYWDIPFMVMLSVVPMVIAHYFKAEGEENCLCSIVLAGLTFSLLPLCAGWNTGMPFWKLFVAGAVIFGVADMFYTSIGQRVATGPKAPLAWIANGFLLYLASQCLQGLL